MKHIKTFENLNLDSEEYYIPWSVFFNTPPYYQTDIIKKCVEDGGGKKVHTEDQYGWSNQPEVVVFTSSKEKIENIKTQVKKVLGTEHFFIELKEEDWK